MSGVGLDADVDGEDSWVCVYSRMGGAPRSEVLALCACVSSKWCRVSAELALPRGAGLSPGSVPAALEAVGRVALYNYMPCGCADTAHSSQVTRSPCD